MAEQRQLTPFRYGTRQNIKAVKSLAFSSNTQLDPIRLPQTGFCNRIWIRVTGTMTLGAGTSAVYALANRGPWNLLKRLRLEINVGSTVVYNTSGFGNYLVGGQQERSYLADAAGSGATTPNSDLYAAAVGAAGAKTWALTYMIPVASNNGNNFATGILNLQSPQVEAYIYLTTGQELGDAVAASTGSGHTASFAGTIEVYYEYYEVPFPGEVEYPAPMLHRILEEQKAISQVGENVYEFLRQGLVLQVGHIVTLNGVRDHANVDEFVLNLNNTQDIYRVKPWLLRQRQRLQNGVDWPVGVVWWDLWHAQEDVATGDTRDAIDTEAISVIQTRFTVNSAASIGASDNITTIRRFLQRLSG